MTQIFNEFRFYPNKNQKRNFFIGAHVGYGMYNKITKMDCKFIWK